MPFAKALVWSIVATGLSLACGFGAYYAGHWIGLVTVRWMSLIARTVFLIALTAFAIWVLRVKINKRSWTGMALPPLQTGRLLFGMLCGVIVMGSLFGIQYLLGWLHFAGISHEARSDTTQWVVTLIAIPMSISLGFSEELVFRGYVFQTLGEHVPVWIACLMMGTIFAFMHFTLPNFGLGFVVGVIPISTLFLVLRYVTGSLWFPIGFHAMWDWTEAYFLGIKGSDPCLIQFTQTGPSFWVGSGQTTESGILYIAASLALIVIALIYGRVVGKSVPWANTLTQEG
jgi:uncharacterized protein